MVAHSRDVLCTKLNCYHTIYILQNICTVAFYFYSHTPTESLVKQQKKKLITITTTLYF